MSTTSQGVTTDLYRSLRSKCALAGISLREACRRAGIDPSVPDYWKRKTPKSIESLRKLESAIEEAGNQNK